MKSFFMLCALAVAVSARPEEQYTNKYDSVDVPLVLENSKVLKAYIDCLLDLGKCTAEAKELKSHVRDAMENGCAKCTKVQQTQTRNVIRHLINKEQGYWQQLTAKYDPEGKYTKKYESELKSVTA